MGVLVSVIVPVYNNENYLKSCLDSIINQTYHHLDIILVDDGSTDSSGAICDEYASADNRIQVIHKKNGGNSDARNTGLRYVRGEWIVWVDNDDMIHHRQIEVLLTIAEKYGADIAVGGYKAIYEGEMPSDMEIGEDFVQEAQVLTQQHLYDDSFIHKRSMVLTVPWCKICKTRLYNGISYAVGRSGGHNPHDDTGTTWKLYENAGTTAVIFNYILYYWRNHSESTTMHTFDTSHFSGLDAYREQLEYFSRVKKQRYVEIVYAEYLEFFFWCYNRMNEICMDLSELRPYYAVVKRYHKNIKLTKSLGWKNWLRYYYLVYYKIPKIISRK